MFPAGLVVVAPVSVTLDPTVVPIVNVPPVALSNRFPANAGTANKNKSAETIATATRLRLGVDSSRCRDWGVFMLSSFSGALRQRIGSSLKTSRYMGS